MPQARAPARLFPALTRGDRMHYDLTRLKRLLLAPCTGPILEAFDQRRRSIESRLRRARKRPSERAIHHLRVSLRRMLSMLALLDTVLPSGQTRPLRRRLKKELQRLGRLRDIQNQIVLSEDLLADFPQLTAFRKHLLRKERCRVRRVARRLSEFEPRRVRKMTRRLLDRVVGSLDPAAERVLAGRIEAALEDAYRSVLLGRSRIDPGAPASIHRTRVAFKKFRYMAEIAAPCFPRLTDERLRAMHAYHDRMGSIQDLETLLRSLMSFRRSSGRTSILVVENEIRRRRQRLIDEFMGTADEIRFFWSTPQIESREVV